MHLSPMTLADARSVLKRQGPQALQELVLARAAENDDNAVIAVNASSSDISRSGPLGGIPFGVKDNIDVERFAMTGGSPALRANEAHTDAPTVAALKAAGGYVPVKLNLHELAFGITSNNAAYGPVRNPFDRNRVAGGSSGGNGAAIARGVVPFALGTDTGGSTRIPAAFCGVAGFRPSTGRYASAGVLLLSRTRDTVGPMAANCADLAEVDALITGHSSHRELPDPPLRLGVLWNKTGLSTAVDAGFAAVLAKLVERGEAELTSVAIPDFDDLEPRLGAPILFNEALQIWTSFCMERLGMSLSAFSSTIASLDVRSLFQALPSLAAETLPSVDSAFAAVRALRATYEALFRDLRLDAIVMPTVPVQPPMIGEDGEMRTDLGPRPTFATVTRHTVLATLTGAPSVAIPAGFDRDGLPLSLLLEGPRNMDRGLLAMACRLEAQLAA